jgi:hypothetical protein
MLFPSSRREEVEIVSGQLAIAVLGPAFRAHVMVDLVGPPMHQNDTHAHEGMR